MHNTTTEKTQDFVNRVNSLLQEGIVKNYAEIVKTLEWDKTIMSNVMNGRKNVPNEVYRKFMEVYCSEGISPALPDNELIKELIESLKRENAMLRKVVDEKDERIKYLVGMLNSSATELLKQVQVSRSYLKTIVQVQERMVAYMEKKPVEKIRSDIHKLLGEALTGAS